MNKINLNKDNLLGICIWDKNYLLVGSKNKKVILIDLNEGIITKNLIGHNNEVLTLKKIIIPQIPFYYPTVAFTLQGIQEIHFVLVA